MAVTVLNRMVVAVGIGAVALFGLSGPTSAQPQPKPSQAQQGRAGQQPKGQKKQEPGKRLGQGKVKPRQGPHERLAPKEQQELIRLQHARLAQYRDHLNQQQRLALPLSAQLRQQNRMAQFSVQRQYVERVHEQQLRLDGQDHYNYAGDPFFYTPPDYRYSRAGRYYETNQSGVDLLRQAVNYGYQEGFSSGLADRQDRWESRYEDSYAYQDANYGYGGFYVERVDYNNYFREGFRRGYEDGYNSRNRYGTYSNGKGTVLGAVLTELLNFEAIR